jgi:hypothetical protein
MLIVKLSWTRRSWAFPFLCVLLSGEESKIESWDGGTKRAREN